MLASKCHNTLLSFYRAQYSINFVSQLPFGWAMHFAKIVHSISNNQKGTKGRMLKKLLGYAPRRSLVQALKQHQIKQTNDWQNPLF